MKIKVLLSVLILACIFLPGCPGVNPPGRISTIQDNSEWSFVILGDVRSGYDIYRRHIEIIRHITPSPAFLIILGDIVSRPGIEKEWMEFKEISAALPESVSLYVVAGNHDVNSRETNDMYMSRTNMPGNKMYYSFTHRGIHFIGLHTELPGEAGKITGGQYRWLADPADGDLAKAQADPAVEAIVIIMHRPLFPQGRYKGKNIMENAEGLHSLFESGKKVRLIAAGHEHQFFYYKKNGISHIISGGGGAPLYHENGGGFYHQIKIGVQGKGKAMKARVIGLDGRVLKEFDI